MAAKRNIPDMIEIRRLTWRRWLADGGCLVLAMALTGTDAQEYDRDHVIAGMAISSDPFDPFSPSTPFTSSAATQM